MKTFFIIIATVSCVFIGNVEGVQKKSSKKRATVQIAQNEREILLQKCSEIRSQIATQFSGMGTGALKSSGYKNAVKQAITNYLNSVGTPIARQLLNELQSNGFKGFI